MTTLKENVQNKAKSKTRTKEREVCKNLELDPDADDFVCSTNKAKVGFACSIPGPN